MKLSYRFFSRALVCTGRIVANDENGGAFCAYDVTFDVKVSVPTKIDRVIICAA